MVEQRFIISSITNVGGSSDATGANRTGGGPDYEAHYRSIPAGQDFWIYIRPDSNGNHQVMEATFEDRSGGRRPLRDEDGNPITLLVRADDIFVRPDFASQNGNGRRALGLMHSEIVGSALRLHQSIPPDDPNRHQEPSVGVGSSGPALPPAPELIPTMSKSALLVALSSGHAWSEYRDYLDAGWRTGQSNVMPNSAAHPTTVHDVSGMAQDESIRAVSDGATIFLFDQATLNNTRVERGEGFLRIHTTSNGQPRTITVTGTAEELSQVGLCECTGTGTARHAVSIAGAGDFAAAARRMFPRDRVGLLESSPAGVPSGVIDLAGEYASGTADLLLGLSSEPRDRLRFANSAGARVIVDVNQAALAFRDNDSTAQGRTITMQNGGDLVVTTRPDQQVRVRNNLRFGSTDNPGPAYTAIEIGTQGTDDYRILFVEQTAGTRVLTVQANGVDSNGRPNIIGAPTVAFQPPLQAAQSAPVQQTALVQNVPCGDQQYYTPTCNAPLPPTFNGASMGGFRRS